MALSAIIGGTKSGKAFLGMPAKSQQTRIPLVGQLSHSPNSAFADGPRFYRN
jgi:hypothetical protein